MHVGDIEEKNKEAKRKELFDVLYLRWVEERGSGIEVYEIPVFTDA